jgi:hypothetical protein
MSLPRYEANRIRGTISRAFRRLQERGLGILASNDIDDSGISGLTLTDQGLEVAKGLTVNCNPRA